MTKNYGYKWMHIRRGTVEHAVPHILGTLGYTARCGYRVHHPDIWQTNPQTPLPRCRPCARKNPYVVDDARIHELADEAERGYDPDQIRPRNRHPKSPSPPPSETHIAARQRDSYDRHRGEDPARETSTRRGPPHSPRTRASPHTNCRRPPAGPEQRTPERGTVHDPGPQPTPAAKGRQAQSRLPTTGTVPTPGDNHGARGQARGRAPTKGAGMPNRPPTTCNAPGCPTPTHNSRCAAHSRPNADQRGYTAQWKRGRLAFLVANPACVICRRAATVADHHPVSRRQLVDRGDPDPDAPRHLRPLCQTCHGRETARHQPSTPQ